MREWLPRGGWVGRSDRLGAAYLAGLASGFWTSVDEQSRHWQVARTYEPVMSASQAGDLRERWSQAVKRSLQWASPDGS